jgi:hypothetical protein
MSTFKNQNPTFNSRLSPWSFVSKRHQFLVITLLIMMMGACTQSELPPESQIRNYLYQNQPMTAEKFVEWANEHLAQYSTRRVYKALYNEGTSHAKSGHPNAVAMLSYAARAWAADKHLPYDPNDWQKLQEQAIANIRQDPGELQLWPSSN